MFALEVSMKNASTGADVGNRAGFKSDDDRERLQRMSETLFDGKT